MKRWMGFPAIFLAMNLVFSGCALFLVGAGVAGGVAISEDGVEGKLNKDRSKVWNAAQEVLSKNGEITSRDEVQWKLEAKVQDSNVYVTVLESTSKVTTLSVKARTSPGVFPNVKLAQSLYTDIVNRVRTL